MLEQVDNGQFHTHDPMQLVNKWGYNNHCFNNQGNDQRTRPQPKDWDNKRTFTLLTKQFDQKDELKPTPYKGQVPMKVKRVAYLSLISDIPFFKVTMEQIFASIKDKGMLIPPKRMKSPLANEEISITIALFMKMQVMTWAHVLIFTNKHYVS